MKQLVFLIFLFISFNTFSSTFVKGKIIFKDGQIKEGMIKLLNSSINEGIAFKKGEHSSETIDVEKIQALIYYVGGQEHMFEYIRDYRMGAHQVEKNLRRPTWQYVVAKGGVTLYLDGISDLSVKDDKLVMTFAETQYYRVMKKDEAGATTIAMYYSSSDSMDIHSKTYTKRYFIDYPELVAKVEKEKITWKDFPALVELYNKWKEEELINNTSQN